MFSVDETDPRDRGRDRNVVLLQSAMTLVALGVALWLTRGLNPLRGDSAEYLYFDQSRSVGYPAFLELVRVITGRVALAVPIQLIVLASSLVLLGWRFHQLVRAPIVSIAFQVLLLIQASLWFASAFIMTEALSAALIAWWCAILLSSIETPKPRRIVGLITVAALATIVRPSHVALLLATILFCLVALPRRERARALMIAAAALALSWAINPVAQYLVHGSIRTTSPFARGVLQDTLYCDPRTAPADRDARFIQQQSAPVRAYIATAPIGVREQLRREYSSPLRFGLIIPTLGRWHHLDRRSQVDPVLARIAADRVVSNPACYAASVVEEYFRMTVFSADPSRKLGDRTRAFLAAHPPVEVPQVPILPGDERLARAAAAELHFPPAGLNPSRHRMNVTAKVPLIALLPFRLLYGIAALIGLIALARLPFRAPLTPRRQHCLAATAALGLAFHVTIAITAIVEIGFFRYLVPLWPIVCLLLALAPRALLTRSASASTIRK